LTTDSTRVYQIEIDQEINYDISTKLVTSDDTYTAYRVDVNSDTDYLNIKSSDVDSEGAQSNHKLYETDITNWDLNINIGESVVVNDSILTLPEDDESTL
jgi:hypothetical protein